MYSQDFQGFLKKDVNEKKCVVSNVCYGDTYKASGYLSHIRSPQIVFYFIHKTEDRL